MRNYAKPSSIIPCFQSSYRKHTHEKLVKLGKIEWDRCLVLSERSKEKFEHSLKAFSALEYLYESDISSEKDLICIISVSLNCRADVRAKVSYFSLSLSPFCREFSFQESIEYRLVGTQLAGETKAALGWLGCDKATQRREAEEEKI